MGVDERNQVTYFAQTDSRNRRVAFGIKAPDRTRHVYCIGKTGMGKSTMLENMAIQDIRNGNGLCFIDPHGKTAELLLDFVPEERIRDVLYFAPFDMEHPIAFNVMEDVGPDKRHLVANGLMSTFEKIWVDAWSARMAYILNNTILALLEYSGSTLLGINRMLSDKDYRRKVVENVSDPSVKSFWVNEFARYTERFAQEATPAIQNKVGQFTANPLIRNIVGQPKSTFNLRQMMDERKIIIINLSKGLVGEGNANLLGSMLITKVYLAAMSRADVSDAVLQTLPNFNLFVDEFQSFANKSFANILSESRKYKLNLIIAHQYIEQMEEEVRAAVFGNVGTMVAFRVGAYDAEVLEKEFAPQFTAEDMVNLGFAQIYLKLMIDGVSSPPFSATTLPPFERPAVNFRDDIIENTRRTYARPRAEVEVEVRRWHEEREARPAKPQTGSPPYSHAPRTSRPPEELGRRRQMEPGPSSSHEPAARPPIAGQSSPAVRPPRPSFAHPKPVERVEKPISLEELKRSGGEGKSSSEKNSEGLRQALSEVLKQKGAEPREKPKEQERAPAETPSRSAPPTSEISRNRKPETENQLKHGVPDDVLRNILDVKDE